ncbi:MAG: alpha/beta fold hydrolase [Acetobacteraceae bacterium]
MIEHAHADLGDVRLHYVTAGDGFPVVLLHGWPQSWYEWRHIIPGLTGAGYRVIAPDLRGLGDSSRPADGYDKKTVGGDVWRLVHDRLGISEFFLVGHDWGGPTAYAVAAAHPEAVKKLAILDVAIPGDGSPNISQGGRRWHHAFHQTLDLPEALVAGREDIYLGWFYRNYGARPLADDEIAEYLRTYRQPGALRAGFSFYRALPQDIADNAARLAAGFKLPMPVLALGGDSAWGRRMEVVESLQRLAVDVRGGVIANCGHWMPEEQPEELLRHLLAFFGT